MYMMAQQKTPSAPKTVSIIEKNWYVQYDDEVSWTANKSAAVAQPTVEMMSISWPGTRAATIAMTKLIKTPVTAIGKKLLSACQLIWRLRERAGRGAPDDSVNGGEQEEILVPERDEEGLGGKAAPSQAGDDVHVRKLPSGLRVSVTFGVHSGKRTLPADQIEVLMSGLRLSLYSTWFCQNQNATSRSRPTTSKTGM